MPLAAAVAGAGVLSAGASIYSSNKAAQAAKDAANASKVDIDALDAKTREMALKNATDSAALEAKLTPEVPALRKAANQGILNTMGQNAQETAYQNMLMSRLGQNVQTPLLNAAAAKAQSDLNLGGNLGQDTQNMITRQALANGGTFSSGGGLGMGRDLVARDLGLNSLQLENQRLNNASTIGQQQATTAFNNQNNFLNQGSALSQLANNQYNRYLSAGQYGQSIAQPVVGLDPSSVANIYAGNASNASAAKSNLANIYGAQGNNLMSTAGNLGGLALMAYGNSGGTSGGAGSNWGATKNGSWYST